MKFVKGIKIFITASLLLCFSGAAAVTLPGSSYTPAPAFDDDNNSASSIVSGIRLPSSSFVALGTTDCSLYSSDKEACDACCEAPYDSCLEDCGYTTDCYQSCAAAESECKKAYCPSSLPLDGGMWVLAVLVIILSVAKNIAIKKG